MFHDDDDKVVLLDDVVGWLSLDRCWSPQIRRRRGPLRQLQRRLHRSRQVRRPLRQLPTSPRLSATTTSPQPFQTRPPPHTRTHRTRSGPHRTRRWRPEIRRPAECWSVPHASMWRQVELNTRCMPWNIDLASGSVCIVHLTSHSCTSKPSYGGITTTIKHAIKLTIKLKTSPRPARLAQLLQPSAFCCKVQPMTTYQTVVPVLQDLFQVLLQLLVVAAIILSFKFYRKFYCMFYCSCDPSISLTQVFAAVFHSRFWFWFSAATVCSGGHRVAIQLGNLEKSGNFSSHWLGKSQKLWSPLLCYHSVFVLCL